MGPSSSAPPSWMPREQAIPDVDGDISIHRRHSVDSGRDGASGFGRVSSAHSLIVAAAGEITTEVDAAVVLPASAMRGHPNGSSTWIPERK